MHNKIKQFFKNDYKQYFKSNILFFCALFSIILNGLLLRIFTVNNGFELKPLLGDFALILFLLSFMYLIKPKKRIIYIVIISVFCSAICIINSMYYTFYSSFASVSLIATSFQISDVGDAVVQNVLQIKDFFFLWQPIFILVIHNLLKNKPYYKIKKEKSDIKFKGTIFSSLILLILLTVLLNPVEIGRFFQLWNREFSVSKFGVYLYQTSDIVSSIKPKVSIIFGYDNAIKNVNDFYENKSSNLKENKYTNILKDKNVIMIHAESIQQFTMGLKFNGEELTPNLNKLANNGLNFTNFYAQVGVGTSSDTEFTISTSLLPVSSGTVAISYWNREFITMQKLLKDKSYYTFSMHGNNGDFWNRNNFHKTLGYDELYDKKYYEIDEEIGLGLSDKSFFRQSTNMIKEISLNNKKYFGTLIMLTNHTPFDKIEEYGNFPVSGKKSNGDEVPYMEGTTLGNYFKAVHYADAAIGEFIESLEEQGLLENTVIVIYGDHDARLYKKDYERLYNYDFETDTIISQDDDNYIDVDYYSYELNRKVPFIIYTKDGIVKEEINTVMGMYDVLPTLGNMLGINSKYALGNDIFNLKDNIVVFPNGNWLSNKVYFNNQKREYL
ncbi:MAG: LTA synthase family protein, partial [Bacilli bacterium]|nr:LTA synthase family protein [Bacilli bacterium]